MSKHKLMLPILAAIVGVAASAFTTVNTVTKDEGTWYMYNGPTQQTQQTREDATNYIKISGDPLCSDTKDECAVELNQNFGNTPNFSNVSFDSDGFPSGGTSFVTNEKHE